MRLVKFLAHAGVASRRKAAKLVEEGKVSVNGVVVTEPWFDVSENDEVSVGGTPVHREEKLYVLLNKPAGVITTLSDPQGRKTVSDFVKVRERIFPVGRLDRDTTGILLLTNDGDLAHRLLHPRFEKEKVYVATLDYPLLHSDVSRLLSGIQLNDGPIAFDSLEIIDNEGRKIKLSIHSGRNRIIRRTFSAVGYRVEALDRISFAGISYGNLKRGEWRFLSPQEILKLKRNAWL